MGADEYTYAKVGRGCYAVYGPDGREVTRYGFESDAVCQYS